MVKNIDFFMIYITWPQADMEKILRVLIIFIICSHVMMSDDKDCGHNTAGQKMTQHQIYRSDSTTRCCVRKKCPKGLRPLICSKDDPEPPCVACPENTYNDGYIDSMDIHLRKCHHPTYCRDQQIEILPLTKEQNRVCICDVHRGYYNPPGDGGRTYCSGPRNCSIGTELHIDGECIPCPLGKEKLYYGIGNCTDIVAPNDTTTMYSSTIDTQWFYIGTAIVVVAVVAMVPIIIIFVRKKKRSLNSDTATIEAGKPMIEHNPTLNCTCMPGGNMTINYVSTIQSGSGNVANSNTGGTAADTENETS